MPKTTTKPDRLKQAHDKLQAAVESIVTGDDWQRMLQEPNSVGPPSSAATSAANQRGRLDV